MEILQLLQVRGRNGDSRLVNSEGWKFPANLILAVGYQAGVLRCAYATSGGDVHHDILAATVSNAQAIKGLADRQSLFLYDPTIVAGGEPAYVDEIPRSPVDFSWYPLVADLLAPALHRASVELIADPHAQQAANLKSFRWHL